MIFVKLSPAFQFFIRIYGVAMRAQFRRRALLAPFPRRNALPRMQRYANECRARGATTERREERREEKRRRR